MLIIILPTITLVRSFEDTFRVSKTTCNIMKIETENGVEIEKKELNNDKTNTCLFHKRSNINKYTMKHLSTNKKTIFEAVVSPKPTHTLDSSPCKG